jgi:hypothetical protein
VDLLPAPLVDVRDHQGRPRLLHQVRRGGRGGLACGRGPVPPQSPWAAGRPRSRSVSAPCVPAARRPRAPPGCTRSPARPWSPDTGGRAQVRRRSATVLGRTGPDRTGTGRSGPPGARRGRPQVEGRRPELARGAVLFIRRRRSLPIPDPGTRDPDLSPCSRVAPQRPLRSPSLVPCTPGPRRGAWPRSPESLLLPRAQPPPRPRWDLRGGG